MKWRMQAACRDYDLDLFFPDTYHNGSEVRRAKAICASCPVREECLAYAIENGDDEYGIFGGTTPRERVRLRRQVPV